MARGSPAPVVSVVPPDPAEDWSGVEPAAARARRRAEFWPNLFATLTRSLFLAWGVGLAVLLFVNLLLGWSTLLSPDRTLGSLWVAVLALSGAGAWLAFSIAGMLTGEIEEATGPSSAESGT
jgi:hypothetical protein